MAESLSESIVARRRVYHVGGHDPMPPEATYRRFVRELGRFEVTWSLNAAVSKPEIGTDMSVWSIDTTGANWHVNTRFHFVRWDDVMASTGERPLWRRIPAGLLAFADFVLYGALWRYLRVSWRYGIFFLYPFVISTGLVAIACAAGVLTAAGSGSRTLGAGVGLFTLVALVGGLGRRLYLPVLLNDWIFARRYVWHSDPVIERRLDLIAEDVCAAARGEGADEILIVGHSLGAVIAVDLLDRALKLDPALGSSKTRVAFVSVGSSILKIGLHRAAERFRAAVARVASAPYLFWCEYQALTDPMNFYSSDPIAALGLPPTGRPLVRKVWFKQMLDAEAYRRIRRNFFRLHNQFVSGNTRRAAYDYFMMLCGPLALEHQFVLTNGFLSAFAAHGAAPSMLPTGDFVDDESIHLVPQ